MYSLSGGYLGLCASIGAASRVASRKTRPTVSFFISGSSPYRITLASTFTALDGMKIPAEDCHAGGFGEDELRSRSKLVTAPDEQTFS
jgi:hypothetical protein